MNWITNFVRPKVKSLWSAKPDTPDNLWKKCPGCAGMIFHRDLDAAQYVCMHCDHHLKISATARLKNLFDEGLWEDIALPEVPIDPLKFKDDKRYADRLREARAKTGEMDAIKAAQQPHHFLSVTKAGHSAIVATTGNEDCHVILRGGSKAPNFDAASVRAAWKVIAEPQLCGASSRRLA